MTGYHIVEVSLLCFQLRRVQAIIKDRDCQFKHELKKKQKESEKLMARLHQLLMDKNPDRRIGNSKNGINLIIFIQNISVLKLYLFNIVFLDLPSHNN